jgi:hypothetical protein
MQFEFAVETQKVRKREQKHQKAGVEGTEFEPFNQ